MDLGAYPLVLGGNVFGWTADEATSHAVLDAFVDAGGRVIDTADAYSHWVPGNQGGESEAIIGSWLAKRGRRDDVIIATKVSKHPQAPGLSQESVTKGVDASLKRLGTDYIDLYYAHYDDPDVPIVDVLGTFTTLVKEGKVRAIAASNFGAERLAESLRTSDGLGLAGYIAYQGQYNLMERDGYEGPLRDVIAKHGMASLPYYGLARGFLTGKYRPGVTVDSPRAEGASGYLDERGMRVLAVLEEIAGAHGVSMASVALAWLVAQPTITAAIASARNLDQLHDLLAVGSLTLGADEIAALTRASDH